MGRLEEDTLVPARVSVGVELLKLVCVDVLGRPGGEGTLRKRVEVDVLVEDVSSDGAKGVARVEELELSAGGSDSSEELH